MKYRKKPMVIEAFQLTDDPDMIAPEWFARAVDSGKVSIDRSLVDGHIHVYGCTIETLKGRMRARLSDYIIQGLRGELYPCKPDIFVKSYEKVG